MKIDKNGFAQLVIYDQQKQIKTVIMNQPQVLIGREKPGSKCDVCLSSELVSAVHGAFYFYNGEYYYVDNINVNGTYINGRKIPKESGKVSSAQKLRDGDILSIGVTEISHENTVYIYFSTSTQDDYFWDSCSVSAINRPIYIGRDSKSNDIVIPDIIVSKKHAVITRNNRGEIFVNDLKSVNGTIHNGTLMKPNTPMPFKERDYITIGSAKIVHLGSAFIYCLAKPVLNIRDEFIQPEKKIEPSVYVKSQKVNDVPHSVYIDKRNNAFNHAKKGGVELRVENLTKTVPCKKGTGSNGSDKKNILENVSLTIYPGELVAILGGSGAGKTTLMNAINGFEPATKGSVYFNGNDLYKNYKSYKTQIGYVPQQDIVYDNLTMEDMLSYVAKLRLPSDLSKSELSHRVDDVLRSVDLLNQKHTFIKKLSGGQRKRASIAVELISDPSLFFLDEPTSGLDPEAETNLMKQLQNLSSQKGKTIIVITHTLQNIHLFDKVIFMAPGGKLCFYGSPEDAKKFFEVDNLSDAYEKISNDVNGYVSKYKSYSNNLD